MCDETAATLRTLLGAGFSPRSVVEAVLADDLSLLRRESAFSVQLQPPDDPDQQQTRVAPH